MKKRWLINYWFFVGLIAIIGAGVLGCVGNRFLAGVSLLTLPICFGMMLISAGAKDET